jgi:transposase
LHVTERQAGDVAELARRAGREPRAAQRDRYRAVLMALDGKGAPAIAKTLARSRRHVQDWVYAYRDGGIDGLRPKPRPGRPTKLPRGREAELRARLGYTLDGAYDLLHRLGYSCLTPRPMHEKNDPAAAEHFKGNAPLL